MIPFVLHGLRNFTFKCYNFSDVAVDQRLGFDFFKIQDISFHTLFISVSVCVYTSTCMHQGQLGEGAQFSPFTTWVLGIKIRSSGLPAGAFMP